MKTYNVRNLVVAGAFAALTALNGGVSSAIARVVSALPK